MSTPLLPSETAQFSAIIDGILAHSNLDTVSAKTIRKELAAKLDLNLDDKRKAVAALIHERFDHAQQSGPGTNGHSDSVKTEPTPSNSASVSPDIPTPSSVSKVESEEEEERPKKKVKRAAKELDDAKLAAKLQAQENLKARPTRGGATKKATPRKKAPRKKSEKKVKAEDDSDIELDENGEVKEKPKKGGFHKLYILSTPLAELVGEPKDPGDKRQILCDDRLYSVFKQDKVHMFTMNKLLGKQLYPDDTEEDVAA
ncbi:putative Upstream activation factor subunit spp27 [Glarea lozoyensis 74030]|uniref:Putative Upstream activation factor subunit spp27 n=1 Tax=Glarea lozoyensis (strain ATCC 74030 / MF5533) TaxID=1104152 RepID=H0EHM3_GLAL7|nr:putative Upstream activation factor subunit spp27 [Glarea lozoyensis 74030]